MYGHPQQNQNHEEVLRLRHEAGVWLKSLREASGLSQRQFAARVGVEQYTFISQIESGRGRIPPDRYQAWADALGVNAANFVRELLRFYDPHTYRILFGVYVPTFQAASNDA